MGGIHQQDPLRESVPAALRGYQQRIEEPQEPVGAGQQAFVLGLTRDALARQADQTAPRTQVTQTGLTEHIVEQSAQQVQR